MLSVNSVRRFVRGNLRNKGASILRRLRTSMRASHSTFQPLRLNSMENLETESFPQRNPASANPDSRSILLAVLTGAFVHRLGM
jgi:hypothetical protein